MSQSTQNNMQAMASAQACFIITGFGRTQHFPKSIRETGVLSKRRETSQKTDHSHIAPPHTVNRRSTNHGLLERWSGGCGAVPLHTFRPTKPVRLWPWTLSSIWAQLLFTFKWLQDVHTHPLCHLTHLQDDSDTTQTAHRP